MIRLAGRLPESEVPDARDCLMLSEGATAFVAASRKNELRSSAGVIGLASSVFVFAAILALFYRDSDRETRAAKRACEKELAQCTGDAGHP